MHAERILSKLSGPPYSSTLTRFARRRPGESNVVGRELHADAPVIEPHHLPIGSAPVAGERDRMPAITNGSIGIVVPDLAISIGPANDDSTTSRPAARARSRAACSHRVLH